MTEIHVLEAIKLSDIPTMTNVANRLRVTVGTLTTSIHTLVKKGYVLRTRGVEDKRVVNLKLTDLAKEALVIHDRFHDEMIDSALKDLNLSEDEVLIKSLEGVKEYFKNRY